MPKLSVIIPVYNVEEYLRMCLDSVVNQTLKDIEIICINDGSTDNSGKILDDYTQKDNRITVIHKKNKGVSVARNIGIDKATGEYLMFVDSDDLLTLAACETAYNTIAEDGSDMLIYGHSTLNNGTVKTAKKYQLDHHYSYTELSEITNDKLVHICKIYKKKFIQRNNIKFLKNCKTAEDIAFCWTCYLNKAKISEITKPLYIYRINPDGATGHNPRGIASDFYTFKEFEKQNIYQQQPKDIQYKIINHFCGGYNFFYQKNIDNKSAKKQVDADMNEFCKYLESKYSISELKKLKSYKIFKHRHFKRFLDSIFSMINEPTQQYKIVTILGVQIRIKRNI